MSSASRPRIGHLAVACLVLIAYTSHPACSLAAEDPGRPGAPGTHWLLLQSGTLATLEAERTVYAVPGSPTFLVHLRLVNRTGMVIWADLDSADGPHPNQWGACPPSGRSLIDEKRPGRQPLDDAGRHRLIDRIATGTLCRIPALGAVDAYRAFHGAGTVRIEQDPGPCLFISISGGCLVTDGAQVEDLSLEGDDIASHDILLPAPVHLIQILPVPAPSVQDR